jgi:glycosyltransferase involved in cell wall biosynthesis
VAGDGPARAELERAAGSNVEFVGHLPDEELVPLMQRCAATVFPSVDDFGLIPVETMACGRPVLAFAGGGAMETVVPGRTGDLFGEQTAGSLLAALRDFDPDSYDPAAIRAHAETWDASVFRAALLEAIEEISGGRRPDATESGTGS